MKTNVTNTKMNLNTNDYVFIAVMVLLAAFIWLRDLTWVSSMDDTLPILVALPLFVWLEWPWSFQKTAFMFSPKHLGIVLGLLCIGILFNWTLFLALGWCWLLWTWISQRVDAKLRPRLLKLMILPLMAFPWITLDAHTLGWWFRLSGAWATGKIYALFGFNVAQEGTQILVNNLPISVDVSCAGLNTLQSMLIAGSVLAYIQLGAWKRYWINLPLLVLMAWVANTLRITMLTGVAVGVSPEFAMGAFHESGGWVVLFIMFCMCWMLFTLQQPKVRPSTS